MPIDGFPDEKSNHPNIIVSALVGGQIPFWYTGNVYYCPDDNMVVKQLHYAPARKHMLQSEIVTFFETFQNKNI